MTTPGGVPNLPAGALTPETMASKLQDMTVSAQRARAAARVPSIFDGSTGGNPLSDLSPWGIITHLFAGFAATVANADPADITGPEDLPGLLLDFIEGLPVIGQLVGLAEAILGTYDGDDPILLQIQDLFAPIRQLLQMVANVGSGFPTPEGIADGWHEVEKAVGQTTQLLGDLVGDQVDLWRDRLLSVFSPVHVSRVTDAPINLLDDPFFELADSISPVDGWSRDETTSATGVGGSAKVVCDGSTKQLFHRTIIKDVIEGHTYNLAAQIETDGLVLAAFGKIVLAVVEYHGDAMGNIVDVATRSSGSATWVLESGNYTVPAGVTSLGVVLKVVGATAGSVWFSALDLHETDLMPTSYVSGLDALLGGFTTMFNQIGDIVNGLVVVPFNDAVASVQDWWNAITSQAQQTADDVGDTIRNFFNGWFGGTTATGHPAEVTTAIESIKTTITGGWTVEVLTTSGTWTKPAEQIIEFWVCGFGSGSGAGSGDVGLGYRIGGPGGPGGRYFAKQIDPADIPTTVAYTIPAGGAPTASYTPADTRGDVTFGSLLTTADVLTSSIASMVGFYSALDSKPGDGGAGAWIDTGVGWTGEDGGRTPSAAGGTGGLGSGSGPGAPGNPGGNANLATANLAGGGGGGGGGGGLGPGGAGGNGGWPGGGAGGGGAGLAIAGAGGYGGNGALVLRYRLAA